MIDLFTLLKELQTKAEEVNGDHPTLFQSNIIIPLRPNAFSTIEKRGRETRPSGTGHQTLKMVGKIEEMRQVWNNFCMTHQQCSGGISNETWNNASMTFQKRNSKITLIYKNKGAGHQGPPTSLSKVTSTLQRPWQNMPNWTFQVLCSCTTSTQNAASSHLKWKPLHLPSLWRA